MHKIATQIITLNFSINRCYILKTKNAILIDGGPPGCRDSFIKQLDENGISSDKIKLIILTHGDFDHIGSAKEFKAITGAKIAIHESDRVNLEKGLMNWSPGVTRWGKISRFLLNPLVANKNIPPVKADIIIYEKEFPLYEFGIEGKIIYTPGHTLGSISVLLDSGEAFVGCMAQNRLPFTLKPKFPIYAVNIPLLKESWRKLINAGAKTIYPGHGNPFSVDRIKEYV